MKAKRKKRVHWTTLSLVVLFIALIFQANTCSEKQGYEKLREKMVDEQLVSRGISSKAVLDAMRIVPRHLFVPEDIQSMAYSDSPLPIGLDQTISQPYIVALMTEQVNPEPGMKVLEIGTGSGYQAAVLAQIGCEVYSIELLDELAERAKAVIGNLNYDNVTIKCGNGYLGLPEKAPFDAIIVTAAPENIPEKLVEQLKDGGVMVVPVGPVNSVQSLKIIIKKETKIMEKDLLPVRFVPMVE